MLQALNKEKNLWARLCARDFLVDQFGCSEKSYWNVTKKGEDMLRSH